MCNANLCLICFFVKEKVFSDFFSLWEEAMVCFSRYGSFEEGRRIIMKNKHFSFKFLAFLQSRTLSCIKEKSSTKEVKSTGSFFPYFFPLFLPRRGLYWSPACAQPGFAATNDDIY